MELEKIVKQMTTECKRLAAELAALSEKYEA